MRRIRLSVVLAALLCMVAASSAHGADRILWVNEKTDRISRASLFGGGAGDIPIAGLAPENPSGLTLDVTAGRLYWAERGADSIRFTDLEGSGGGVLNTTGATVANPSGLAIEPASGRVYWANTSAGTISFADPDGSGGGDLNTGAAPVEQPYGVAVHPQLGRIYWANFDNSTIGWANLDGSGGGALDVADAPIDMPYGVAIDTEAQRIYWGNRGNDTIGYADVNGRFGGALDTHGQPVDQPGGLAIVPLGERIYWTNAGDDTIRYADARTSESGQINATGATVKDPGFPILVRKPWAKFAPYVAPHPRPPRSIGLSVPPHEASLECATSWFADLPESFYFRLPQAISYRWIRVPTGSRPGQSEVLPDTGQVISATRVGTYWCSAAASNYAGTTFADPEKGWFRISGRLKIARLKVNRRRGTARVVVHTSGEGQVAVRGEGILARLRPTRLSRFQHLARVAINPKRWAKRKLRRKGKVRVRVRVAYTPEAGAPIVRRRTVVLRLNRG